AAAAAGAAAARTGADGKANAVGQQTVATTADAASATPADQNADAFTVDQLTAAKADTAPHADAKTTVAADAQPQLSQTQQQQRAGADSAQLTATPQAQTKANAEVATALKEASNITIAPTAAHAAQEIARAATAVPTDKLSSRVGSQGWDQQLGQKIVFMAAGGEQSATMELNPPDLGPLQVVLSVNKDQATAAFTSAAPEVRQALESAMPKLKEMMSDAGIQLGSATVSAGMQDQGGNASSQQAGSFGAGSGNGGTGRSGGNYAGDTTGAEVQRSAPPARRLPPGAVDTFA
ncbi:flagellar hook-length control protein FliK, partial [Duganella callida]